MGAVNLAHATRADQALNAIRPEWRARIQMWARQRHWRVPKGACVVVRRDERLDLSSQRGILFMRRAQIELTPFRGLPQDGVKGGRDLTPAVRRHERARAAAGGQARRWLPENRA
jgi:hypothetical protein